MDDTLLEDFGQRVDLTRRIREVLVNYPEGTTVLKELIQNADDAGATTVRLCLDRRRHGVRSLLSEKLSEWQGPALLAYNDAVFSEEDFVSISRIGGSKKRAQAWKTGRFGVGFNSVYHLTDLPSFVSNKYVVLFDPQGTYLPSISASNPGKRLEFVSSSAISFYEDQFFPYCVFGCDMKNPFNGTLFRLPLRNAKQASVSKLSRQMYSENDISLLFSQLHQEATLVMLFLKSVVSIEMYIWDDCLDEPQKLYSCSINSVDENTIWHRQAIRRHSNLTESTSGEMDSFTLKFCSEEINGTHSEKKMSTFFVVQAMAPSSSEIGRFAATASHDYDLHILPWASVAACLTNGFSEDDVLKQGKAFCFLPLPVRTGLTVQVNGYFEVSSNRRSIWFGDDMDRGGKLRSEWNKLLLKDVIAPIFSKLILCLRELLGPTKLYYSLWPTGTFEVPWDYLVDHIYRNICHLPVVYSELETANWISPAKAFIHDQELSTSNDLIAALLFSEMPVVHLSKLVIGRLSQYVADFEERVVNPANVRNFLMKKKIVVEGLSRYNKLVLLEYCLSDLIDAEVGKHANGLPLLPLASGDFGTISESTNLSTFFICNELEYQLLELVSYQVIDKDISPNLLSSLSAVAKASQSNIAFFDVHPFIQFLPKFFPNTWKYKTKVPWPVGSEDDSPTLSLTWLSLFWQYIEDKCLDLSVFDDWPIFPSISGHLFRGSKSLRLINVEPLPKPLKDILCKIGCKILDPCFKIKHQQLSQYVYDADGAGVVNAIFDVIFRNSDNLLIFNDFAADEKNDLRQFLLDPRWYYDGVLDKNHIEICKKLPIYRTYGGGLSHSFQYSDLLHPPKFLPPSDVPIYFLSAEFIYSFTQYEEQILQKYYEVERMQKTIFYRKKVFNRIYELTPEVRDAVMLNILRDLPQLSLDDASFKEQLKSLEFVPTSTGNLKSPQSLYDPRVEELYALLEDSDCFPHGLFQEPTILDMLHSLGLRTFVSCDTILQSAHQIEGISQNDQLKAHSQGKVLLSYLEVYASKWSYVSNDGQAKLGRMFSRVAASLKSRDASTEYNLEKFWNGLRLISWCPVLVTRPNGALPWPSVSSMVAPPKLIRLQEDMWLVSASMRILDGNCSSALACSLGWSSKPGGSVIAAQLLELGKNNEIIKDQALRQELTLAMPKIYSLLMSFIGSDEMDLVKVVLEGCRWIWVGDGFATVEEVTLEGHLHLAPYIRVIPTDLEVFRELFLYLGVKELLEPSDYANILLRMANRKVSAPLNREELRTTVLVLQHLAELQSQNLDLQIFLPDVSARLFPAKDLVYNDAPWLLEVGDDEFEKQNKEFDAKRNIHKYVHGNIPNDVAEKLGVCSLRRLLLAESSDTMHMGLSGVAEAFGQHEALTTRLKHIVEMYADGPGILFELVQNAEDAGASEVVFLLDKTQYGTSSILSPQMAEWQGPALYCYNNSIFSPQDLYAISRIGQDSKLEKPLSIGRFGLGFNCVYHFTDVPGFISGDNFVTFDPHACYLPGISPSHPGLRIRFVGRRLLEQFPDQFTPFLQFGCDLQHPFPGTLFRFPLRGETAALHSQIKKEKYAPEAVESLFGSFSEVVSETLVFLRKIKKISLYVKDGSDQEMQLLHCVTRHTVEKPEKESHPLHAMLSFLDGNMKNGMGKEQFFTKLGKTMDKDLPWTCERVTVMERNRFSETSHMWMISECIGGGRARRKCLSSNDKSYNFVPWACVAAYLHSDNNVDVVKNTIDAYGMGEIRNTSSFQTPGASESNRKKFSGRAFCFLPLPINTGFPVHLNAYFELSSNRRDIWFGNDMVGGGKMRSDWNVCLLEDVIAPAYAHLIATVASDFGPCELFFSVWPTSVGVGPWVTTMQKLYTSIVDMGLPVFYTEARGGQWISAKQAIFPDLTFGESEGLSKALSEVGLPVITLPKSIFERFVDVCPSLHYLNPHFLRSLLIRRKSGFKNNATTILVLEYCLSDMKGPAFFNGLLDLPLVPLANGSFTSFRRRGEGERIYVTCQDEYELLLDSLPHLIVDWEVPELVHTKLHDIALSGKTNLCLLTSDSLLELFPIFFPAGWLHAKQVSWIPGEHSHPSIDWMKRLWRVLKSSCNDLSVYTKWPILPVGNDCLVQLTVSSNVISNDGWSENMSSLLHKLGCFLLISDMQIDHPQLKNYVQDATAAGLLSALLAVAGPSRSISSLFINISEGERHELRSFLFQSKWFSGEHLGPDHIDLIKLLPIFESYTRKQTISLNNIKWLKPENISDDLIDDTFVRTESERERNILRTYFRIREPSRNEFYMQHVLNHMKTFISKPTVLSQILLDVKILIEEDDSLKAALSETPFVLAANGSWQCPSRLYDPRVPGLQKLLHREAFFPCDKFSSSDTLETLVGLGLRRTLGYDGLLDSARSVSMLHDSGKADAVLYGRRLLVYVNALGSRLSSHIGEENQHEAFAFEKDDDLYAGDSHGNREEGMQQELEHLSCLGNVNHNDQEEQFWREIKAITWCPVYVNPPAEGLPWLKSEQHVASPNMTRPKSQMWMVSSAIHILDGECESTYLHHKLGWMEPLDIRVLSVQLLEISKTFSDHKFHSDSYALLNREIPKLYSKLQEFTGHDALSLLKNTLNGVPWVWVGDNFVSPKAIAFDSPVKFHPYLYVVPSELSDFRLLLTELGVKVTFDVMDYLHVLQSLQNDVHGMALSAEQLSFVCCVLEAVLECSAQKQLSDDFTSFLLVPDSLGVLRQSMNLVYNDAPWMDRACPTAKYFLHPSITEDLARRLGIQSLRSLSLVNDELVTDIPCMDYSQICNLLSEYGDSHFLLFDLLELADCCKAKKVQFIYDKREHARESLLQQNLGEFQGPSLVAVMEGTCMSREEICNLQFPPPWNLKGTLLNYGLGLLTCHFICDFLSVISSGYLYMFDPLGLALAPPSNNKPSAKMFSLIGTDLTKRFRDQFQPMLINEDISLISSDSIVVRMPLSSKYLNGSEADSSRVKHIFDQFMNHASSTLLFLKSVLQVSVSTWDIESPTPHLDFSISVDPSSAAMRNPFAGKKWKKFHLSRLFSNSNAVKLHAIDLHVFHEGVHVAHKWLTALCLGSGQTRNMALDRQYLAYDLTPIAGVAVHLSQDGQPVYENSFGSILSPLPLSGDISLPVTALGCFLVCHNGGRYLFNHLSDTTYSGLSDTKNKLREAWNRELMSCVRDSYVELVLEFQRLRRNPFSSSIEPDSARALSIILQAYGDRVYSFWPRSKCRSPHQSDVDMTNLTSAAVADWLCLVEQVIRPFYVCLVDLPVWQLYHGNLVKASEGMFLCQSASIADSNLPPARVCDFIREHYPVFSVPSELVSEIQAVGVKVREIKPKMVRDLLKSSSSLLLHSMETYIDVLGYCLSDIPLKSLSDSYRSESSGEVTGSDSMQNASASDTLYNAKPSSSSYNSGGSQYNFSHTTAIPGNDAREIVSNLGKALYDFGRGVVEDIGRAGAPLVQTNATRENRLGSDSTFHSIVVDLKGMPFPTANMNLARLGATELWVGNKEHHLLMHNLVDRFVHLQCLEHPNLAELLFTQSLHSVLKLNLFNAHLLSVNLKFLFSEKWINRVMYSRETPWFFWESGTESGGEGPSTEWIQLFWRVFQDLNGDLSLVNDWPLIPATLGSLVLCRARYHDVVFMPPLMEPVHSNGEPTTDLEGNNGLDSLNDNKLEPKLLESYLTSFNIIKSQYSWLLLLLKRCNIPVYDVSNLKNCAPRVCFPAPGQTLGKVIIGKLLAAKRAGLYCKPEPLLSEECDRLFTLFAVDFELSNGSAYTREEFDFLREFPIYKTTLGSYTLLDGRNHCLISPSGFFHPKNELCLVSSGVGVQFLHALGVPKLRDHEVLVKFALPGFEGKTSQEQEDILIYLYMNWDDLQFTDAVVNTLKETKFVFNAVENGQQLFKPCDLLDPCDCLLLSVFSDEKSRFPSEKYVTEVWLQILRKSGLRTSSEADVLVECARKVELRGKEGSKQLEVSDDHGTQLFCTSNGISAEELSLAESVVVKIFANFSVLYDKRFCDLLSKIAFIPGEKGFPSIGGKTGGKLVLCSYDEAILMKDWPLAWSCSPILIKANVIPPEFSWGAFHLRSPPAFSTVLKHLQTFGRNNGEDSLAHWPTSSGMLTVEDAASEILQYLDKMWGSLSSSDIAELQNVSFLPVANGTRLVTATSLFVRLAVNLSPFAFELSTCYLPYVKILKDIGVQDALTVSYAKDLLLNIQRSCGYQHLNPNELRAVMEILRFICDGASQEELSGLNWIPDAVVPDDGCRLVLARTCAYVDPHGSNFLSNIDSARLRFVHPELPVKTCTMLGVKKLSDIIVEEVDNELVMLNSIGSVTARSITDKLLSRSLQEAIWVIVRNLVDHMPSLEGLSMENLQGSLEAISKNLQFVKSLYTRFLLLPNFLDITRVTKNSVIPEWEESTKHRAAYFVDKSKTCILVAEPPNFISVFDVIASVVSQVLGMPVVLPIGSLFSCPGGSEKTIVNALRLGCETAIIDYKDKTNILLGKELLPQDALQVQFHPLRPFYSGEIVAWRSGKNAEKLKYGRVPQDVRPSAGQALYRFNVETAPGGSQPLLSSQVLSFSSVSMADGLSSSAPRNLGKEESNKQVRYTAQTSNSVGQSANEHQFGRVSATELVEAVRDMLAAAGIPIDFEKQTLLEAMMTLQERVEAAQVALLVEQEKADLATKEVDAAKAAWSCRICLSNEVSVAIVPCGHVLCHGCSSAVNRCPFCRNHVSRTVKIYRP